MFQAGMCTCARTCMCALTNTSIYTIISLNLSLLANCRSQFLLDHLGRRLKLFIIFFIREKHTKRVGNRVALACVYLNEAATAIVASGTCRHGWAAPTHRTAKTGTPRGVCVRACACVHACVRDVFAIYDNNI